MMGGYLSPRTTLCVLAGAGAVCGGVAGAAIVGKLATDGPAGTAVARDEPAVASSTRASQVAVVAAQSPSRVPTPWSAADAEAARVAGERQRARREHVAPRAASRSLRISAASAAARVNSGAGADTRRRTSSAGSGAAAVPPAAVSPAPQVSAPAQQAPAQQAPVRVPARAPEPAPKISRPSPEPSPARSSPKPDPTGAFDDSG